MIFKPLKKPKEIRWSEIAVGDTVSFSAQITAREINRFIALSGDTNPLHRSPAFARQKGFKKPIVHGMLASSLFSALVGVYLPGAHALYVSQTTFFRRPIYAGERITIRGVVVRKIESVKTLYLETTIMNQDKKVTVSGEAIVKYL
ncbi:MAG: MaoC family dehydratase [Parcubacteria group bacterium]|nr:MaoC family dehydratase [Parcubacteria group bacterium]